MKDNVVSECCACRIQEMEYDAATAFLAGIAFAYTHNNAAIRRGICPEHAKALMRGAEYADPAIKDEDRRRREGT